jgi:hypothetical protein
MVPLYACRIEDLEPGDFVKVTCDHTALLAPAFLFRLGLEPGHDNWSAWLGEIEASQDELLGMLGPFPSYLMRVYPRP